MQCAPNVFSYILVDPEGRSSPLIKVPFPPKYVLEVR